MLLRALLLVGALLCGWCAPAHAQAGSEKAVQARSLLARLKQIHDDPKQVAAKLLAKHGLSDGEDHDEDEGRLTKRQRKRQLLRRERKRVRRALRKLGKAAQGPLLAAWKTLPVDDGVYCLSLLSLIGSKPALAALLEASNDLRVVEYRRFAAGRLTEFAKLDRTAVVGAQLRLLRDPDGQVLQGVLGGLRFLAPDRGWDPLLNFLDNSLREEELAGDGRIGAAVRALGAILTSKPDAYRVEQLFQRSGELFDATELAGRSAKMLGVLVMTEDPIAAPFLRGVLLEAYLTPQELTTFHEEIGFEGSVGSALESLDALRPFPPEIRSVAIVALGAIKDQKAVLLLAKALKDTHDQPRRDAMSAISLIQPTGRDRKEVFRNALRLLVHSDRILRHLTHKFFVRTTGKSLPLSYTAWRKWLETDYLRVQVLECLRMNAESQALTLQEFFALEGAADLEQWLEQNEFADYRDFLDTSDLVPEDWPPEDYGEVPEAELLKQYEE